MAQRAPTNRPQADVEQVHNQARFQQSGVPDFGTASPQMLNIPDVKLDTTNIQINRQQIAESKQDLKVLGSALAKQEAVNLTTDIYSKVFLQTDAYLKANPSGQGLADTMMDLHQQLTNQAIDSASSSESIQLIRMVSAEQKQHLMPALYNKEKDTSFKFLLNETEKSKNVIESQLLAHPDQAVALKEQYLLNMEPIRKANPQAFLEVQKHWLRDFDMTHFSGTNYQSPWAARELIGKLNNVTAEDRKKMYHHVDTRIESLRKQQRRLEKANEKIKNLNQAIEYNKVKNLIQAVTAIADKIPEQLTKTDIQNQEKAYDAYLKTNPINTIGDISKLAPVSNANRFYAQAETLLHEGFRMGLRNKNLENYVETSVRSEWAPTPLNNMRDTLFWNITGPDKKYGMHMPPHKRHPELSPEFIKNKMWKTVQYAASHSKDGIVSLKNKLVKSGNELIKKDGKKLDIRTDDITLEKYPIISVTIDGKTEDRQVFIEEDPYDESGYVLYWNYNEGMEVTKQRLTKLRYP